MVIRWAYLKLFWSFFSFSLFNTPKKKELFPATLRIICLLFKHFLKELYYILNANWWHMPNNALAFFRCIYHKFATCYSCQIFYIKYLSSLSHISIQLVKNVKLSPTTHQYKHPLDKITLAVNWDPLKRRIQTTL